jgi:hypothetical protein
MLKRILTTVALVFVALPSSADGGYAGTLLRTDIGARALAMGGAYTAVSGDPVVVWYNPGALGYSGGYAFGASYTTGALDRHWGYAAGAVTVQGGAVLGGAWVTSGVGDVERRSGSTGELLGEVENSDQAVTIAFSRKATDWLSLGIGVLYLHKQVDEVSSGNFAATAGAFAAYRMFRFGLSARGIGGNYRWDTSDYYSRATQYDDKIPIEISGGVAAATLGDALTLAASGSYYVATGDNEDAPDPDYHFGAEYVFLTRYALRAGLNDGRLSAGAGLRYPVSTFTLGVDYAFNGSGVGEGLEHTFAIELEFGR